MNLRPDLSLVKEIPPLSVHAGLYVEMLLSRTSVLKPAAIIDGQLALDLQAIDPSELYWHCEPVEAPSQCWELWRIADWRECQPRRAKVVQESVKRVREFDVVKTRRDALIARGLAQGLSQARAEATAFLLMQDDDL